MNILLHFLDNRFNCEKHIIVTTHSPFLVSDTQKADVISLGGKSQGAINSFETFGANIHELLSDNFFLREGYMGDFSRKKIIDLIAFLKYKKGEPVSEKNLKPQEIWDEEKAKGIIGIIGEPLIRERLENLFDAKYFTKDTDIVKSKIAALQGVLKKIENEKNKD